jgi:hypothetical protein
MEALQRLHNRGSISTGINNSVKLEADNTEYLERDPSSAGDRQKFTISMWVKRTEIGQASSIFSVYPSTGASNTTVLQFGFMSDDRFQLGLQTYYSLQSTRVFRDTSAWYHMVLAVDTTQSTSTNRFKLYVNGVLERNWDTEAQPAQNHTTGVNDTEPHRIGTLLSNSWYFSGYMAEINHVDGSQLAPTDFGEFDEDSGIWKPKKYTGSYGTNGFYLDFEEGSNMGNDASGGTDFTETNITAADQATDTPTNNFCTLNPLNRNTGASSGVTNNSIFTEGNTKITGNLVDYWQSGVSTIGITAGKWYFEAKPYDSNTKICTIGYGDEADIENWGRNNDFPGASGSKSYAYAGGTASGYGQISPSTNQPSPAVTYNQTNIIGVAIDADNGYVYWSKDGTYINNGNPASGSSGTGGIAVPTGTGTNGTLFPAVGFYYDGTVPIMLVNFGGYTTFSISSAATDANGYGTFEYAPPSGYYALCTKNLEEFG